MKLLTPINKFLRKTREKLSHYPIIYAIIGAVGIILFWRGVWHTADFLPMFFLNNYGESSLNYAILWDSLISAVVGFILLLFTGLFVSDFIGAKIISSEIKTEEKIVEKTEAEEKGETKRLEEIEKKFDEVTSHLDEHLENIEKKLKDK
ncbi:MAG: hypothetical protein Q7K44_03050 [Candidatus Liptonbacteria bacterium]|nr:hypothetical protein [Candidatus Liptonbacteria bacterium]